MKRTENKLKAKGFKTHAPFCRAHLWQKYDRNHVVLHYGDVKHLPFSRGPYSFEVSDGWYNKGLYNYLMRFLRKQVGKKLDVIFHEFKGLGWKSSKEMYYYWSWVVEIELEEKWGNYQLSDEGVLLMKRKDIRNKQEKTETTSSSMPAAEKKLSRKQLAYNEKVNWASILLRNMKMDRCIKSTDKYIFSYMMGKFYVEYENQVFLCPVYRIALPKYSNFGFIERYYHYRPIKILGRNRRELVFGQDTKEKEDTQVTRSDTLIPWIDIKEAQQLLKEATT